jgi:hypothetical protein
VRGERGVDGDPLGVDAVREGLRDRLGNLSADR